VTARGAVVHLVLESREDRCQARKRQPSWPFTSKWSAGQGRHLNGDFSIGAFVSVVDPGSTQGFDARLRPWFAQTSDHHFRGVVNGTSSAYVPANRGSHHNIGVFRHSIAKPHQPDASRVSVSKDRVHRVRGRGSRVPPKIELKHPLGDWEERVDRHRRLCPPPECNPSRGPAVPWRVRNEGDAMRSTAMTRDRRMELRTRPGAAADPLPVSGVVDGLNHIVSGILQHGEGASPREQVGGRQNRSRPPNDRSTRGRERGVDGRFSARHRS
jgi:hypothetical protein